MLKSLIEHERIETSVAKAKELKRHADHMITLAKKNTLASKRQAIAELMITRVAVSSKEARVAKKKAAADKKAAPQGRHALITKLFGPLVERFAERNGGYTRVIKGADRVGDNAPMCILEFIS
jgi:large subunit ribosomal protein L17